MWVDDGLNDVLFTTEMSESTDLSDKRSLTFRFVYVRTNLNNIMQKSMIILCNCT